MPSVLFWTCELPSLSEEQTVVGATHSIARTEQKRIYDLVNHKQERRKKFKSITITSNNATSPSPDSSISFQVAHCRNNGNWDLVKASAFDIVVVIQDNDMVKDFEMWEKAASGTQLAKNLATGEKRTPAFLARPGAHIFFVVDGADPKPERWLAWTKTAAFCTGRQLHLCDNVMSYAQVGCFWRELVAAVVQVHRGVVEPICPSPPAALPPSATKAAAAAAAASSSSSQPPNFPLFPPSWSRTPSVLVLHKPCNRSCRWILIVLEGVVTLGDMKFLPFIFPGRGAVFTLEPPPDASGLDDIEDDQSGRRAFVAGEIFIANFGGASGNARVRAIAEGSVLRAVPWPEQGAAQQLSIWDCAWKNVFAPRLGLSGAPAAAVAAATVAAAAPPPPPHEFIFTQPSSVQHIAWMRLKPLLPTEEANKEYQAHVHGMKDCLVHVASGISCEHHIQGYVESEKIDEERSVSTHFTVCNMNGHDSAPAPALFLNGGFKRVPDGSSKHGRLVHAETGACYYVFIQLTGSAGTKLPILAELCDFVSLDGVVPPLFFDNRFGRPSSSSSAATTTTTNENNNSKLPLLPECAHAPSLVEPYPLLLKDVSVPSGPEAAAERDFRAETLLRAPVFDPKNMHNNYDEDFFAFLLLGRNNFSRESAAEQVALHSSSRGDDEEAVAAVKKAYVERNRRSSSSSSKAAEVVMPSLLEWALGVDQDDVLKPPVSVEELVTRAYAPAQPGKFVNNDAASVFIRDSNITNSSATNSSLPNFGSYSPENFIFDRNSHIQKKTEQKKN